MGKSVARILSIAHWVQASAFDDFMPAWPVARCLLFTLAD